MSRELLLTTRNNLRIYIKFKTNQQIGLAASSYAQTIEKLKLHHETIRTEQIESEWKIISVHSIP